MSFNYSGLANTATRLINDFGGPVTLRVKTAGAYDSVTGVSGDTFVDNVVTGVKLNFKNADIDGTLIKMGDVKVLLDGKFSIGNSDLIIIGTDQYEVIAPMPLEPGNTRLLTMVQCRR